MPVHRDLEEAFGTRADGVRANGAALVGTFGEGVPRALVASLGGMAVDIKAPPLSDSVDGPQSNVVDAIAEPFLDPFARRFLHRFAAGAFDRFATLVFVRDDAAALVAYQYALELRRQGRVKTSGPRLFLWNLVHSSSAPASVFNGAELDRLKAHLMDTLGGQLDADALAEAVAGESRNAQALRDFAAQGPDGFVALNAGRWMRPEDHAALVPPASAMDGLKIALAGTACDIPVLHELCAEVGHVIADLQDYGRPSPQPTDAKDLLSEIVGDPLAIRAVPPARFSRALLKGISGADLVIASVCENDESFGWELPGLRRAAEARGARFLDLGFRPFRPDADWEDAVRSRIREVLA